MRLLVDTSAWVEYLRGAQGPTADAVRQRLQDRDTQVVTCEPVALELLAGAGDERRARKLETLVNGLPSLGLDPWADYRDAARIFRTARASGETIRSLTDCLIASVALNHEVTVLHRDRDFEVIGRLTGLAVVSA